MPLRAVPGSITAFEQEAAVTAANERLAGGGMALACFEAAMPALHRKELEA